MDRTTKLGLLYHFQDCQFPTNKDGLVAYIILMSPILGMPEELLLALVHELEDREYTGANDLCPELETQSDFTFPNQQAIDTEDFTNLVEENV